jgi:hypothetical protein
MAAALPTSWMSTGASASPADDAYASSIYDYCDAKKIAAVWNTSVGQAKVVIGQKILGNLTGALNQDIQSATHVRCDLNDIGLSYQDAEKLANYWGRTVGDAKGKAIDIASRYGGAKFRSLVANVIGYH